MRNLDHFVMPVADLASARDRFVSLGFTVAPNANHPFGTQNCCVFFSDDTFIEPLAIGDHENYQTALAAENSFLKGHRDFTTVSGLNGFSHLVVKSGNAKVDHIDYVNAGISGGGMVDFGRTFTKPDGTTGEVAFSLAFAKPQAQSDAAFFACEIVKAVPGGKGTLVNHANDAMRTKYAVLSANDPSEHEEFFRQFLGAEPQSIANGVSFTTETSTIEIITLDVCAQEYGAAFESNLCLQALVLQVADLATTRELLAQNNINFHNRQNRIIVPPALGQGGIIVFEE